MKKLKLAVESLRVESFEPASSPVGDGTVRGFGSMGTLCDEETCGGGDLCATEGDDACTQFYCAAETP